MSDLDHLADRIEDLKIELEIGTVLEISNILAGIVSEVKRLNVRLAKVEGTARSAADSASCLANGIKPD